MNSLATTLKTLTLITALATLLVPKQVTSQIPTQPTFFSAGCNATEEGSYIRNSAYSQNLNIVLTQLTDRASDAHFYNSSAGDGGSNTAYGQFYCRGDISTKLCQDCVKAATQVILEGGKCFLVMSNRIYFRECTLRYGNKSYVGLWTDTWTPAQQGSLTNVSDPTEFGQVTRGLIGTLIKKAAYGGDPMEFATGEGSVTQFETVYCLLQCSPDIVDVNCEGCLKSIARYLDDNYLAYGPEWVLLFYPNCQLRYSLSLFYSNSSAAPTPAPQPPSPNPLSPSASGKGKKNVIIIIAPAVIGSLFLLCGIAFAIWFCLFRRKRNTLSSSQTQQQKTTKGIDREESEIGNLECFSFRKIEEATMKFSVDNKLGEGGFGSVYKGILPGGHLVAIKRLSRNSGQGIREFKTEVAVVAKLQQRNLVRLVGFCVENEERILVYEYLSNLSLDKFIFDATKSFKLDWRTRYKIIEGIASGLRYLHVDSLLTIVHRDLKSSNILLDNEMNPKIADFGMARLVQVDETTRNTSRIAGTYGYMSPEYAMTGRFSIKADIYSLGVIILEILSGKSIIQFDDPVNGEGLLHYEQAQQNSMNRDKHGPSHVTGRTSFAEIRHEMNKSGQPVDKMSVWIKSRNKDDHDVIEAIKDYNTLISLEPEDQRDLTEVKDKIFHRVVGEDGHGYCRTYGASAPPRMVYPGSSNKSISNEDVLRQFKEVADNLTKIVEQKLVDFKADLMTTFGCNDRGSSQSQAQGNSVHQRESIGEGALLLSAPDQPLKTTTPITAEDDDEFEEEEDDACSDDPPARLAE